MKAPHFSDLTKYQQGCYCYHMRRIWAKALCECVATGREWSAISAR